MGHNKLTKIYLMVKGDRMSVPCTNLWSNNETHYAHDVFCDSVNKKVRH